MSDEHAVVNNRAANRFEIDVEGEMAVLEYVETDSTIDLRHTGVPATLEGHGVGSTLVRAALEYAKQAGKRVIPTCPFVQAYLKRHVEPDA